MHGRVATSHGPATGGIPVAAVPVLARNRSLGHLQPVISIHNQRQVIGLFESTSGIGLNLQPGDVSLFMTSGFPAEDRWATADPRAFDLGNFTP